MRYAWTCSCCGKQQDTLPLDFAAEAPDYWYRLPIEERGARSVLTPDFCTIDGAYHFIRGCLEVPVLGVRNKLIFGAWVSLSEESARRAGELWNVEPKEDEPPRFGWLSTNIRGYAGTLDLKTAVRFRANGLRPAVELEPTDHLLAREQQHGISVERVQEIVTLLMPRH